MESGQLVALWKEHRAFLKEEENETRLKEENERNGYRNDSPSIDRAMYEVFESVADGVNYYRGTLSGEPEAIARVKARAGADPNKQSPFGYVDRGGKLRLPFGDAVDLAGALCGAEPSTVLIKVEGTERDWGQEARTPSEGYMIGLLNEYRAAWALIRQWQAMTQPWLNGTRNCRRRSGSFGTRSTLFRRQGRTRRPLAFAARWKGAGP